MRTLFLPAFTLLLLSFFLGGCRKDCDRIAPTQAPEVPARIQTAGIVYVPLNLVLTGNPKKVFQNTWTQAIDLDQDTVQDLSFSLWISNDRYGNFYNIGTSVSTLQPGGGIASDAYASAFSGMASVNNARVFAPGAAIGPAVLGFNSPVWTSTYSYSYYFGARRGGTIIGKGDKLIGFKMISKGNTYYGWIKVNISSNSQTFTVKEAAFMNVPDASILAGAVQ